MQNVSVVPAVTRTSVGDMFVLDVSDREAVLVNITSIGGGGTLVFEGTVDNTNWFSVLATPMGATGGVTSTTAVGAFLVDVTLAVRFRLRLSAYTSGNIIAHASHAYESRPATRQVGAVLGAGSSVIGGVVQTQAVSPAAGTTAFRRLSTADINAIAVKASAGKLLAGAIFNESASKRYVKFYNKASAPAPATDTALLVFTLVLQPDTLVCIDQVLGSTGHSFTAGISYAITAALADADVTAIAANEVTVNLLYA